MGASDERERYGFAYLFERFPAKTQTFCQREVRAMLTGGMNPLIVSLRPADEGENWTTEWEANLHYVPPLSEEITGSAAKRREMFRPPEAMEAVLAAWQGTADKRRVYEALQLGPWLRERGIRHVHAHFAGIASRTAYWVKRFYGIPFSFTGHANDIFCESDAPVSRDDLVREARFLVTETEFSRRWLQERHRTEEGKIFRVYNGIDLRDFAAVEAGAQPRRIVSVGRLIEKKGFDVLIEACALLAGRGESFECEIIGEGPMESALRELAEARGVASRVRFAGAKRGSEVREALRSARVFALPCVTEAAGGMDNLPTVIVEAMATGLPVVSTPIAGVPEMIEPGSTGTLVPERDAAALAEAFASFLKDPDAATRMGLAGRRKAESAYEVSGTTRQLRDLLVRFGEASPPRRLLREDRELRSLVWKRTCSVARWGARWMQSRKNRMKRGSL
jgi:colanic acid/amylovoran biosynthesis glycosyltransferase